MHAKFLFTLQLHFKISFEALIVYIRLCINSLIHLFYYYIRYVLS